MFMVTQVALYQASSSAAADMYVGLYGGTSYYTANTFCNFELYIPNYAGSTVINQYSADSVMENNSTTNYIGSMRLGYVAQYYGNYSSTFNY
jgi:hypothetical protein